MGAYIRHAREVLGYEKVVLIGWSGGGALSLFYQAQAESPTITRTPAGDPYDLTQANLPCDDGLIFIAAHLSRPETLAEWMDPSVIDELLDPVSEAQRTRAARASRPGRGHRRLRGGGGWHQPRARGIAQPETRRVHPLSTGWLYSALPLP